MTPGESSQAGQLRTNFLSLTPDADAVDRFLEVVPHEHLMHTPRLGLVIIAPDAFALGIGSALARRIARDGFRILDIRVRRLTPDGVSAMFVPNWLPERFRWWMIQRRFIMGVSAALLVTADGEADCGAALNLQKGNRIPALAALGTWRGDFPSLNGVLDLVHTADDFCHVLRNASPFYSPADLTAALQAVVAGDGPRHSATDPLEFYDSAGSCSPFEIVLLRVHGRLLTQITAPAGDLVRRVARTLALLRSEHEHQVSAMRSGRRGMPRWSSGIGELRATLSALREYAENLPAGDPTRLLARLDEAHMVPWDRELPRLRLDGMVADAWEELVLLTTLYYADQELPHLGSLEPPAAAVSSDGPRTAPTPRISASDAVTGG